jgi:hypothetical protein
MPSAALPLETVRDLLGVARALYRSAASAAAHGGDRRPVEALAEIGEDLRAALALARQAGPDTMGHRSAWARVDRAVEGLIIAVGTMPVGPAVRAMAARLADVKAGRNQRRA